MAGQIDLKNFDMLVAELLKIRNELLEATRRIEPQTPASTKHQPAPSKTREKARRQESISGRLNGEGREN